MVYVIDSGLTTDSWYDPVKFADVLDTVYAPQSSITQRQGRTGRVCSGQAYMMYTKELFDSLPEYTAPLILKSDITNDIIDDNVNKSNEDLKAAKPKSRAKKSATTEVSVENTTDDAKAKPKGRAKAKSSA